MSTEVSKQRAYALLHEVFRPYILKKLGMTSLLYALNDPLQILILQWNSTFSLVLPPSDLGIIKQLVAAQNINLSSSQYDAMISSMITLITHAGMPEHVQRFRQLQSNSSSVDMSGGLENAAIVGGLMAAGYFGYKLYEGARAMLDSDGNQASVPPFANINDQQPQRHQSYNQQNQNNNQVQHHNQNFNSSSNSNSNSNPNPNPNPSHHNQNQQNVQSYSQQQNQHREQLVEDDDKESPFMCPITLQVMTDPVITPQGICFEREAITDWLKKSDQCPVTHKPLSVDQLITCYAMRSAVEEYEKMRKSIKIQPSIPASSSSSSSSSSTPLSLPPSSTTTALSSSPSSISTISEQLQSTNISPQLQLPLTNIEITPKVQTSVQVWDGSRLRDEDECYQYPERSMYIILPASHYYLVSRSTGFVVIQNRSEVDVTLISREREATIWDPMNVGAARAGEYVLRSHATQGFDFRGWYCIEVRPDANNQPINLLVTDFAMSVYILNLLPGGGKGALLKMGTGE